MYPGEYCRQPVHLHTLYGPFLVMIAKDVICKLTQIVDNRKQSAGKLWVGTVKAERRQAQGKIVKYRCQQLAQMVKFSGGVMVTVGQGRDSAGL
ncbi:hypothetical protein DPJ42_08485, partial [Salmonella enterica subsp. diarizonae]|nr:hypothetical protein [Salmonella enterica subsp. diarizonae]